MISHNSQTVEIKETAVWTDELGLNTFYEPKRTRYIKEKVQN